MSSNTTNYVPKGSYKNHRDWVTSIVASNNNLVSASRDKTLCIWNINSTDQNAFLRPKKILTGHNHTVQQVCLSGDGQYALSASWDKTLRLWDLNPCESIQIFKGHTDDVLSVSLSNNNRQIISAGRDCTIRLWNIRSECKFVTAPLSEWITCVKFGLLDDASPIVSAGYDKKVRVWDRGRFQQVSELGGHTGYINSIAISPDCTIVASGGQDQNINFYDIPNGKFTFSLPAGDIINSLVFSPIRFWLAAATNQGMKIFDLNQKKAVMDLRLLPHDLEIESQLDPNTPVETSSKDNSEKKKKIPKCPKCLSVSFSNDGNYLFSGFSDGKVRCYYLGN